MPGPDAISRARAAFAADGGDAPDVTVRAPGRVNLIGEHTDYNDGFCLPMALPYATVIAASAHAHDTVELTSEGFDPTSFRIPDDPMTTEGWGRYVHAMLRSLRRRGVFTTGFRGAIATDIPTGASLSSSAALEVAAGVLAAALAGEEIDARTLAVAGREVEHEAFGLPGGLLDQISSAGGVAGHALLLDCRDHRWQPVPMPADVAVVVMDTGTRRELAVSAYADRQRACVEAAEQLGVAALRDATVEQAESLPPHLRLRARHVVTENARTVEAAAALAAGDGARVGALMDASHESLRDDYEVSGPALDAIVELAREHDACLGARMTGGGFAGCAVALVHSAGAGDFTAHLEAGHEPVATQPPTATPRWYAVQAGAGAGVVRADQT